MSEHLADGDYAAILEGAAPPGMLEVAERHAAECDECRALLACAAKIRGRERLAEARETTLPSPEARTVVAGGAEPDSLEALPGTALGRYRLLEPLGQGGMGIVYAALDETLQRRVAIKLLARRRPGNPEDKRLLREARAMATVDHPNVVTVHDSGLHEGRVYVVMDLVVGGDLRDWLRAQRRGWREIVEVWLGAARGLVAVHAAGLVHRDFKPGNVLIGDDGRVRVSDFGLVGMSAAAESVPDRRSLEKLIGDDRTETGVVLGTPRYMSPEQLAGRRIDAASDQFSFCVALWEALGGGHPFGDGDAYERLQRMKDEALEAFPAARAVPPRVVAVLRRGLSREPERRYRDMHGLATALRNAADAGRRARRWTAMSLAVLAALGAGVVIGGDEAPGPCYAPPGGDFEGVWDEPTRTRLRNAMQAQPDGRSRWRRFDAVVTDYAKRWSEARRDACDATRVRAEVSEEMLDRRMACLERARAAFEALVDERTATLRSRERGPVALAHRLPGLERCGDLEALSTVAPRPSAPEVRERIEALESELARAQVLRFAGETSQASRRIEAALEQAREVDWAPLTAALLNEHALALLVDSPAAALVAWREAYAAAVRAGELVSYEVGLDGVRVLVDAGEADEAGFLVDVVEAHTARLGGEPRKGALATSRMYLEVRRGNVIGAERFAREALAAFTKSEDAVSLAMANSNLGGLLAGAGRIEESVVFMRRAREASEEVYGPEHPQTLRVRHNEAYADFTLGNADAARTLAEANLAAQAKLELPVDEAKTLGLLGEIAELQGRFDDALPLHERALAILERIEAPAVERGLVTFRVGRVHGDRGDHEAAVEVLRRALTLLPRDDPGFVDIRVGAQANLSVALRDSGDLTQGLEAAKEAYELAMPLGPDTGVEGYHAYALALMEVGRPAQALAVLDPAVEAAAQWTFAPRYHAMLLADRAELHEAVGDAAAALADWTSAAKLGRDVEDRVGEPWDRIEAQGVVINPG